MSYVTALEILRAKAESLKTSAAQSDRLASEHWNDYKRHAENARASWAEHSEIIRAIHDLESKN